MSTRGIEPAALVLAPGGGGASTVLRALSGHRQLAGFDDGGLLRSLANALEGNRTSDAPPQGALAFDSDVISTAVSALLVRSDTEPRALAFEIATDLLHPRLESSGKPRYALGAAGCAERVATLGALFPDAAVIHVVRDPRAVVLQAARAEITERPLGDLAALWLRETTALMLFGTASPGRVHRVPYESLLSDPHGTCERLCRALGLPPQPDEMTAAMREGLSEEEEYVFQRDALEASELAELERALQPFLAALGFRPGTPPSDLLDERGSEAAALESGPISLADQVAQLREERDRYVDELEELRRQLAEDTQLPQDIDVIRWKAKRYDRMRAAARPLRVLKRLRGRRRP